MNMDGLALKQHRIIGVLQHKGEGMPLQRLFDWSLSSPKNENENDIGPETVLCTETQNGHFTAN
jgi:hypothetical protein